MRGVNGRLKFFQKFFCFGIVSQPNVPTINQKCVDSLTWSLGSWKLAYRCKCDRGKFILHRIDLTNTYVFEHDLLDHQTGKWFIHHTVMACQHPWGRRSTGGCIGSTRDEGGGPRPYPGALNCMNDEEFDRKNFKKLIDSFELYLHVIWLVLRHFLLPDEEMFVAPSAWDNLAGEHLRKNKVQKYFHHCYKVHIFISVWNFHHC